MKKIIVIFLLIFLYITLQIHPVYSQSNDPKTTFVIYLNNIYGEFAQYEFSYAVYNLSSFLQSKYKIKIIDNGLSSKILSLELLKRLNLSSYAEISGKIQSVNYLNSKFRVDISLNLVFDNIKTDEIDLENSKNFDGEESLTISDSKAFTLSNSMIEIFNENINKVIDILNK
ncbi:MAG: hypothetical protein ACK4YF_05975 [Exilispira sp.]